MKKLLTIFFILIINLTYSNPFYYDFKDVKILKISIRANYKIYINNKYQGLYTKEYKSILNLNKNTSYFDFSGILLKLDKIMRNGIHLGYKVENIENINFWINKNGDFDRQNNNFFPLIQGIPYFPDDMNIEKVYYNEGKAVVDLEENHYFLPIKVATQYAGKQKLWGENYDLFNITYSYLDITEDIENIIGRHNLKLYFDNNKGMPIYIEDSFTEEFTLQNKRIKRTGFYLIFYSVVETMNKEKIIQDLTNDKIISDKEKEYIKIEKKKEGISIVLENLLFKPDTNELLDSENEKIDKIFKILSKIENRTFLIVGHTALAGTYEEQMKLSFDRAKTIAEELIKRGINPEHILYTGKGAKEPVAPNDTEENRKKNRRVEIIILED